MDLAQALNAPPRSISAACVVPQLKLSQWAALQAWLKREVPSPIAQALKAIQELRWLGETVDPVVADSLFENAQAAARKWPPAVGTRDWLAPWIRSKGDCALRA